MKTDKEILKAFQEQFNTGGLLNESQVLVVMGMARGEERLKGTEAQWPKGEKAYSVCDACGHENQEICNTCNLIYGE